MIINTLSAPEVGDYTNTLWVSPSDPDLIVIGGGALYRSINGGATFTLIMAGNFITEFGHWDQQFMVSPPNFANNFERLYICNDGGIFVTDDIRTAELYSTSDWRSLNHTYQTTQYDGVDGSAASGLIIGGSRDNTLLRLRANETLSDIILGPGDGGFAAVDPSNSSYCYGGGGGYHTGPGEGVLFRSANCSANSISPPDIPSTQLFPPDQVLGYAPFLAAFVLDPNNPERLIYGGSSLWRTNNARAAVSPSPSVQTWTEIKVNPEITPLPSATSTPYKPIRISAVAVAPSNSDIIWVAEYDLLTPNPTSDPLGRLYKTSNGTQSAPSWTTVDDNTSGHNPLEANRYITRIVIDPDDAQVVYVALGGFGSQSGYNVDNLYKTTDGGGEWSSISGPDHEAGGLPRVPIRGFARHPNDPDKLYAGTEIGIYTSDDGGGTWSPVVDGPVNVPIAELKFMTINPNASPQPTPSTVLIAATHGRGLWVTDVDLVGNGNIAPNDFDGDGRSDIAVVRPAAPSPSPPTSSTWYMRRSSQGYTTFPYGLNDDQIVPADFNGDGKTDIAVWRPTDRYFIWMDDTTPVYFQWGLTGDIAVPADYDGDGEADYAVFRPSTGYWYVKRSSNGSTLAMQFGQDGDVPTPADFDGDGQTDICVARLDDMEHIWYLHYTNEMMLDAYIQFGLDGDIPVVGNYDNDDVADVAVWRPDDGSGSGYWYITHGITGWVDLESIQWGRTNDVPVPGDYDGDGRLDIAVWRPTQTIGGVPVEGMWYIRQSTLGYKSLKFGSDGDTPVPHKTDTGIGRPANDGDKRVPPSARPQRGAGPSHNVK